MSGLIAVVAVLVIFGSVLAMAEASISRMSLVRALALREEGRRNASKLVRIQEDPPRYLNSVYLSVMFAQNGSAILVAVIAERAFGNTGVAAVSFGFTLLYFVFVEAMSKTWGILRSDSVALTVAPLVTVLARALRLPTRILIGLANVLLPGKGLREGPFVTEEEIRSMADVGGEEGVIEDEERRLIHSIFEFGDTLVREVMVPRPDMVVIEAGKSPEAAMRLAMKHGYSRIPVYETEPDNIVGILYAKDLFKTLRAKAPAAIRKVVREPYFVPDTMKLTDLLKEMQSKRVHMAVVSDEFGDVAGLVTLEDVMEEIVGEIVDEFDVEESPVNEVGPGRWRVEARITIAELNEAVGADLSTDEGWQTAGGLLFTLLGRIPQAGDAIEHGGYRFVAEKVYRRRVTTVLVERS